MKSEIVVINTSSFAVERAGYIFSPKREKRITATEAGLAEIRACQSLQVFEPGLKCDFPGCDFVAANEKSLRFHKKRTHHRRRERGEDAT